MRIFHLTTRAFVSYDLRQSASYMLATPAS
jgi:hypothetical protein